MKPQGGLGLECLTPWVGQSAVITQKSAHRAACKCVWAYGGGNVRKSQRIAHRRNQGCQRKRCGELSGRERNPS